MKIFSLTKTEILIKKSFTFYSSIVLSGVTFSSVGSAADRLSLASKRCVRSPFKAQTLLCGSPAQERCWPTTCAHSLAMNSCTISQLWRKESAVWQVTRGTIIKLCRKEHVIGKINHHHINVQQFTT